MDGWWVSPGLVSCTWWLVFQGDPTSVSSSTDDGVGELLEWAWLVLDFEKLLMGHKQHTHLDGFQRWERPLQTWGSTAILAQCGMSLCLSWWEAFLWSYHALQGAQSLLPSILDWGGRSYEYSGLWLGVVHVGWVNWLGGLDRFLEQKCGHLNWTVYECQADCGW